MAAPVVAAYWQIQVEQITVSGINTEGKHITMYIVTEEIVVVDLVVVWIPRELCVADFQS